MVLRATVVPGTARVAGPLGRTNGHVDWERALAAPRGDLQPEPRQKAAGGGDCLVLRATVAPGTAPGGGAARTD